MWFSLKLVKTLQPFVQIPQSLRGASNIDEVAKNVPEPDV